MKTIDYIRKLEIDFEDMSRYDGYYKNEPHTESSLDFSEQPDNEYYSNSDRVLPVDAFFKQTK